MVMIIISVGTAEWKAPPWIRILYSCERNKLKIFIAC